MSNLRPPSYFSAAFKQRYSKQERDILSVFAWSVHNANTFEEARDIVLRYRKYHEWLKLDDGVIYVFGSTSEERTFVSCIDNCISAESSDFLEKNTTYAKSSFEKIYAKRKIEEITLNGSQQAGLNLDV